MWTVDVNGGCEQWMWTVDVNGSLTYRWSAIVKELELKFIELILYVYILIISSLNSEYEKWTWRFEMILCIKSK